MRFHSVPKKINIVLAGGALLLLIDGFVPSEAPDVWIFSYVRLAALASIALLATYFFLSALSNRMALFNVKLSAVLLVSIFLHEGVIRVFPAIFNESTISLLPPDARAKVLAARQQMNAGVTGSGMLHHWSPGARSEKYPWVVADSNGYRNPEIPSSKVDVVLLGSSVLLSAATKRTYPDFLRQRGHSAYSLAMGSYGPQHSLNSYEKFIVSRDISHSTILVLIMLPYDVQKSGAFVAVQKNNGDWQNYLYSPNPKQRLPGEQYLPWTVSMLYQLPSKLVNNARAKFTKLKGGQKAVGTFTYGGKVYPVPASAMNSKFNSYSFDSFNDALGRLGAQAKQSGAKLNVVAVPPPSVRILLNGEVNDEYASKKDAVLDDYDRAVARVRSMIESQDGNFINLTDTIARLATKDVIFLSLTGNHFNEKGVAKTFDALYPKIEFGQ